MKLIALGWLLKKFLENFFKKRIDKIPDTCYNKAIKEREDKTMTKRYVTRQYLWNTFYTWGVWDKKECKWIVNDRLYRRNVIEIADKLKKEEQKKY